MFEARETDDSSNCEKRGKFNGVGIWLDLMKMDGWRDKLSRGRHRVRFHRSYHFFFFFHSALYGINADLISSRLIHLTARIFLRSLRSLSVRSESVKKKKKKLQTPVNNCLERVAAVYPIYGRRNAH